MMQSGPVSLVKPNPPGRVAQVLNWNYRVPYPRGFRGWVLCGDQSDYERNLGFED